VNLLKTLIDYLLAILLFPFIVPTCCFIAFAVYLIDRETPFFLQKRVGLHEEEFTLYKFRTMSLNTANVPSHLANPDQVTAIGKFMRIYKIDELPQLLNVLLGQMSFVGPRPNLEGQEPLSTLRKSEGIYCVKPGITGLAQIRNIDMSDPAMLVAVDKEYIENWTVIGDFKLVFQTLFGSGSGDAMKSK